MNVDRLALIGCGVLAAGRITLYAISPAPAIDAVAPDAIGTPACEAGITVTVDATMSTPCDLDGSQTLNLTWEGADGYDDAWARSEAADHGCATFTVVGGVATGLRCDY